MTSHRDDVRILRHHDVTSLLFCIVIIIPSYENSTSSRCDVTGKVNLDF